MKTEATIARAAEKANADQLQPKQQQQDSRKNNLDA
jgi:hypothetical protein